jgi:HK97 gp10 family phage protein
MSMRYVGLQFLEEKARQAMAEAVTESAEHLVGEAQAASPVDTGTLRASIHVGDVSSGAASVTARVQTGGEADEYAVYQHEGTSRGVPATKFLEGPLLENQATYVEAMSRAAAGRF